MTTVTDVTEKVEALHNLETKAKELMVEYGIDLTPEEKNETAYNALKLKLDEFAGNREIMSARPSIKPLEAARSDYANYMYGFAGSELADFEDADTRVSALFEETNKAIKELRDAVKGLE